MMEHYGRWNLGWSSRDRGEPVAGARAPARIPAVYSISNVTVTLAVVEKEPGEK